uniref:roquin-1-like n=1 Tax=Panthera onca TaxID=9690 RepID=UPI0029552A67|nr:roquin-1-like [Panthera onca]
MPEPLLCAQRLQLRADLQIHDHLSAVSALAQAQREPLHQGRRVPEQVLPRSDRGQPPPLRPPERDPGSVPALVTGKLILVEEPVRTREKLSLDLVPAFSWELSLRFPPLVLGCENLQVSDAPVLSCPVVPASSGGRTVAPGNLQLDGLTSVSPDDRVKALRHLYCFQTIKIIQICRRRGDRGEVEPARVACLGMCVQQRRA